jgi:hypothetical protein
VSSAKVQSFGRQLVSGSITRAFAISLLLHFAGIAGVELGHHVGWWDRSFVTALIKTDVVETVLKTAEQRAEQQRRLLQQQPPPEAELVFVDVDPTQATTEPPPDAKYYSSQNTRAANRSKSEESNTPKIEGKQEKVAKTADIVRAEPRPPEQPVRPPEKMLSKAEPLQPAPQPQKAPQPAPPLQERKEPKPDPMEKGETLLAKVLPREERRPQPQPNNPPAEQLQPKPKRPSNLAEAYAKHGLAGQKMKQAGGVMRIGAEGLDVKATPFGTYDAMFIEAVQSRWFSLLNEREFLGNHAGRVVVEFRLHQDGRISDLNIVTSTVNEMLSWFCQRAILDPSPYQKFPPDLRRTMDKDYREIRFTFYYD